MKKTETLKKQDGMGKECPVRKSNVILMGGTGCGKTHLAKCIADYRKVNADGLSDKETLSAHKATRRIGFKDSLS